MKYITTMNLLFIAGLIIVGIVVIYYYRQREGLTSTPYYNSGLDCDEFCAKIKKANVCMNFNYKENTKCLNKKGMPVSPKCFLYKNDNCMSVV
jgi:hypothetical protein